jgi:NitT/TauT family transport system permease protein
MKRKKVGDYLLMFATLFIFLALWEILVDVFNISHIVVPKPTKIITNFIVIVQRGLLTSNLGITLYEILVGFIIGGFIGIVIGTAIALSPFLNRIIYPFIVAFQSIPKVAIAPLMVIWFGFGIESKIVMTVIISFFPVIVNTIAGLRSADQSQLDLMTSLAATKWQTFRYVRLPNSLPYVFAGLEIGIVLSVIGAIVGEFVGSSKGLGYLMMFFNARLDVASSFAILLTLGVLGYILQAIMTVIRRRVAFWAEPREIDIY